MKSKSVLVMLATIIMLFSLSLQTAKGQAVSPAKDLFQQGKSIEVLCVPAMHPASLPDLVIRQVVAVAGSDKKLRAHIVNVGNADAGACNLLLFFQQNGQTTKRGTYVTPIAKGKDLWVDVNNDTPIAAASSISFRVDDPNRVKESNELNNSYKFK
jgi:hypothetical protein